MSADAVSQPDELAARRRLPRAACPVCGGDVALRAGGELREHPDHRHELYSVPGACREGRVPKCTGGGLTLAEASRGADTATGSLAGPAHAPDADAEGPAGAPTPAGTVAITAIDPGHWPNPRGDVDNAGDPFNELVASIASQGVLEPLVVGPPLLDGGRHPLIAGWRRLAAARASGLRVVPVHQRLDITDARGALRAALAENMAREDMAPLAEAGAIARLMELGDTQLQAARAVGVSERTARERLRLLELPEDVRDAIDEGRVPSTAGRRLHAITTVHPAAASALVEGVASGALRAGDLLDPGQVVHALHRVGKGVGLVPLGRGAEIRHLPLRPAVMKDVKARSKKCASMYGGGWLDLSPDAIGKALLDDARAAGRLLTITGEREESLYLAGEEWIERATLAALKHAERQTASQAAARARANRGRDDRDPAARARKDREREQAARDAHAQPYAAAMNAELGERLRQLRACAIEGPVARLTLHLALEHQYLGDLVRHGYELVDPDHSYTHSAGFETHKTLSADVDAAETPEAAAALLVAVHVACLYADARARPGKQATHGTGYVEEDTQPLVRAAALHLDLLPDRARRLDAARTEYHTALAHHRGEGPRRRVLLEFAEASPKTVDVEELDERCKARRPDGGGVGATIQLWNRDDLTRALYEVETTGLVDANELHYSISQQGRAVLQVPPPTQPLFPIIDAEEDPTPSATVSAPVLVHVTPAVGTEPVEAELQPDRQAGRPHVRKVIYTASRTASWVAAKRIIDLPDDQDLAPELIATQAAATGEANSRPRPRRDLESRHAIRCNHPPPPLGDLPEWRTFRRRRRRISRPRPRAR